MACFPSFIVYHNSFIRVVRSYNHNKRIDSKLLAPDFQLYFTLLAIVNDDACQTRHYKITLI